MWYLMYLLQLHVFSFRRSCNKFFYSNTAVVEFSPIAYTVTEGLDAFVVLQLIRSGVLTGSSVVTVSTLEGSASGMNSIK